jgi:hypothetical protein
MLERTAAFLTAALRYVVLLRLALPFETVKASFGISSGAKRRLDLATGSTCPVLHTQLTLPRRIGLGRG